MTERFHYRAFGLDIDSELEIAQLRIGDAGQADPDRKLILQLGEVEEKTISASGLRRALVRTQFRYEVVNGRHVTIECLPGADHRNVTDMIAGRVMTSVMYQRGLLPLHASAVSIGGGIVALCGESGTGKSTLAAALGRNGHVVVSDDLLPVRASAGEIPRAWPGASRLKLSQAALDYLGYTDDNLPLANNQEGKFLAGQAPPGSSEKSELWRDGQPLRAIIRIKRGSSLTIRNLRPLEAMADWPLHMRSTDLVPVADPPDAIWQQWLNIVKQVPMLELSRSGEFSELLETVERIEKYLAGGQ